MGKKAVMASARRLKGKFEERWDFEEVYGQAWRGMGDRAREEIVLRAMECMHLEFEDLSRYSVPEITLGNMAGGSGEGFLKLVNALLPGEDLQGDYSVVRHAGWEVVHGIELDEGESLKPRSRSICAMQKGFLLLRHAYMLDFVLNALKEIVSSSWSESSSRRWLILNLPRRKRRLPTILSKRLRSRILNHLAMAFA